MKLKITLLLVVIGLSIVHGGVASASQLKLTQEIKLVDCTNTTTTTGVGQTTNTDCEGAIPPGVNPLTTTDRTPIITGIFDAASMSQLRVLFLGRWYVLGQDGELTVSGDQWRLDLSHLLPPLRPGSYTVTVEIITTHQQLLRATSVIKIVTSTQPPGDSGGENNNGNHNNGNHNNGELVPTGENMLLAGLLAVCLIGGGLGLLVAKRR